VKKTQFIQLIEQEIEDFVQTQADKIVSFEDDPKEYILQKYPSLKSTLEDLMTDSFDEYVTGIYVMAPKPTTFKVLLHNGQHFFLIYAKDSYIAKISGKKYYLSDLGAEEYAIKSISDLLTMGMPPGAEGPGEEADNDATAAADETPDIEPADDTGGDEEELAENVDDIPDSEKDDYGRPFVDPKGSRTFMSDKEMEDMKPSSRILKKMMDKLEKKLPSKKLRILKEAKEKKTFRFRIVKEGQADKNIRDIIIQKNPGFITQSKDKRIGNKPKVSDEEFSNIIKNTFDIENVKIYPPNTGPNKKSLNPQHSSAKFSMFEFEVDGKTYSFILSGGAGANKGQEFEDKITLGLQDAIGLSRNDIENEQVKIILNKLDINPQDITSVEQTGGQDTKRPINPEAGPQDRGKTISDVTIIANSNPYYLSIKNKQGDNIYNGGSVSSITYDNKSNTVSFNKSVYNSDKLKASVFNMFNIDPVKVTDGLNRYIKEEGDVPEWEPIDIDKNEVIKFIGSAIDYGYYYVREEGEGVKVIHLETPEDVSKLIGQITNAQIKYPGNGVKSTYARIGLENSEQGLRYIEVQIRNASGGIANPVIKIQTK